MKYNVSKEIRGLAEMLEVDEETVIKNLESYDFAKQGTDWLAWNRRSEAAAKFTYAEEKEKIEKARIREERLAGFRWIKENYSWVVAGDFKGLEVGSDIIITKASGEKQTKRIISFTSTGNANVE